MMCYFIDNPLKDKKLSYIWIVFICQLSDTMSGLTRLNPSPVWQYFEEICKIPRLSKNEGRIREYIIDISRKNNLESKEDKIGNILITKPSHSEMENRKTVVLQCHMD
ncbi:MAG: aminoacyl-histidine dipeptidase, partial [Bacteroidetes bacterium]|nr:aminoacyl-histidine dipeptidase [Bacteroidota bacterium]